ALDLMSRVIFGRRLDLRLREIDMHLRVGPAHLADPLGRDHDLLARPPVASIRDHIANGPGAIVDGKVFYVTDIAVERGEVVPGHIADASELGVALRCPLARGHLRRHWVYRWRRRRNAWVREESPPIWPRPVIRIAVVARQFDLLLAIDWLVGVDRWAPLHLVSTERDRDAVSGRAANGDRRGGDL